MYSVLFPGSHEHKFFSIIVSSAVWQFVGVNDLFKNVYITVSSYRLQVSANSTTGYVDVPPNAIKPELSTISGPVGTSLQVQIDMSKWFQYLPKNWNSELRYCL